MYDVVRGRTTTYDVVRSVNAPRGLQKRDLSLETCTVFAFQMQRSNVPPQNVHDRESVLLTVDKQWLEPKPWRENYINK